MLIPMPMLMLKLKLMLMLVMPMPMLMLNGVWPQSPLTVKVIPQKFTKFTHHHCKFTTRPGHLHCNLGFPAEKNKERPFANGRLNPLIHWKFTHHQPQLKVEVLHVTTIDRPFTCASSSSSSSAGILSVTTIVQAFTLRPMERSYGAQSCQTKRPGGPRSSMFQQKLISSPSRILQFSANRFLNFIGRSTLVRSTTLTRWSRSRLQPGKLTTTENR